MRNWIIVLLGLSYMHLNRDHLKVCLFLRITCMIITWHTREELKAYSFYFCLDEFVHLHQFHLRNCFPKRSLSCFYQLLFLAGTYWIEFWTYTHQVCRDHIYFFANKWARSDCNGTLKGVLFFLFVEWSGEVRSITYSADGNSVTVVYRVTLYGTDAEVLAFLVFQVSRW